MRWGQDNNMKNTSIGAHIYKDWRTSHQQGGIEDLSKKLTDCEDTARTIM